MMKSIGKLIYSPRSHLGSNEKWAALMCDDEISRYYRHLFSKTYPYTNGNPCGKLTRPVWGSHISFIRNEQAKAYLWGLQNGKIVEFEYEGGVVDNGTYFWLPVNCPYLFDLRENLGLPRKPRFGLHLTVGILSKI